MPRDVPYYRAVMDDIRAQIAAGKLKPGDRLPSTQRLAEQYGYLSEAERLGVSTIREAIDRLINEGVLRGHQGVGVFVAKPTRG